MSVEEQDDLRYIKSRLQPHFVKARSVNDVVQLTGPEIPNSKFVHPIKTLLQHPKLLDYCHRPDNPVTGMEGTYNTYVYISILLVFFLVRVNFAVYFVLI